MTYNVFGGTLNLTQSINQSNREIVINLRPSIPCAFVGGIHFDDVALRR